MSWWQIWAARTEKYRQIYLHHIVFPPEHRNLYQPKNFNIRRSLTATLLNPKHSHTETVVFLFGQG